MRIITIILVLITEASFAQFKFPELSPESNIHQPVGWYPLKDSGEQALVNV